MGKYNYHPIKMISTVTHGWQRGVICLVPILIAAGIGQWYDWQNEKRYSAFVGKTHMFGDSTINTGWRSEEKRKKYEESLKALY